MKISVSAIAILLFYAASTIASAEKKPKESDPHELPCISLPVLESPAPMTEFCLTTSWIPGKDHKGNFRYLLDAFGKGLSPQDRPAYIQRLEKLDFTLNLYDQHDFILRRIPVSFAIGVSPEGLVNNFQLNDAEQMDHSEYKNFVDGGTFGFTWKVHKENRSY